MVSTTVITCTHVAVFPHSSVAVQVRFSVYFPAHRPGMMFSTGPVTVARPQLSDAVSVGAAGTESHSTVTSAGHSSKVGAVVSISTLA